MRGSRDNLILTGRWLKEDLIDGDKRAGGCRNNRCESRSVACVLDCLLQMNDCQIGEDFPRYIYITRRHVGNCVATCRI